MKRTDKYQHQEAFCLMSYVCEKCSRRDVIWNSRDGVTPSVVSCSRCAGEMFHCYWPNDRRKPDHIPVRGQGVFNTLPQELRPVLARIRVAGCDGTRFELQGVEREEMIEGIANDFREGTPFLIRWP